jgi:hypothetical protein
MDPVTGTQIEKADASTRAVFDRQVGTDRRAVRR